MPKDEFDFEDPLELNAVGLACAEDTTAAMTECFVEEFTRLGYDHRQILALFRDPGYLGMNLALQKRGEQFVRDVIGEAFARRGRNATWPAADGVPAAAPRASSAPGGTAEESGFPPPGVTDKRGATAADPREAPVPEKTS